MNDEYSLTYAKYSIFPSRRYSYQLRLKLIKNLLIKNNCKSVLDIGSATGDYAIDLKKENFNVVSIDINIYSLVTARNKDSNLSVVGANIYSLPFKDGSFDALIIMNAFRYFEDPSRSIQESNRVLRNNGHLILIDHNRYCPDTLLINKDVIKYYSVREFRDLIENNGFKIAYETMLFIPPPFLSSFIINSILNIRSILDILIKYIYPEIFIGAIKVK